MSGRKEVTTDKRYQVRADFTDGPQDSLVNSYSDPLVAEHCRKNLIDNPLIDRFIDRAWIVDVTVTNP